MPILKISSSVNGPNSTMDATPKGLYIIRLNMSLLMSSKERLSQNRLIRKIDGNMSRKV